MDLLCFKRRGLKKTRSTSFQSPPNIDPHNVSLFELSLPLCMHILSHYIFGHKRPSILCELILTCHISGMQNLNFYPNCARFNLGYGFHPTRSFGLLVFFGYFCLYHQNFHFSFLFRCTSVDSLRTERFGFSYQEKICLPIWAVWIEMVLTVWLKIVCLVYIVVLYLLKKIRVLIIIFYFSRFHSSRQTYNILYIKKNWGITKSFERKMNKTKISKWLIYTKCGLIGRPSF